MDSKVLDTASEDFCFGVTRHLMLKTLDKIGIWMSEQECELACSPRIFFQQMGIMSRHAQAMPDMWNQLSSLMVRFDVRKYYGSQSPLCLRRDVDSRARMVQGYYYAETGNLGRKNAGTA